MLAYLAFTIMLLMDFKIVQWNVNGFYKKFNEIKLLISQLNLYILCLQETHFVHSKQPSLKNFRIYHTIDNIHLRASGGVAICVRENFHSDEISLNTNLQAVAVKVFHPLELTICNLYIPPNFELTKSNLQDLINQLPPPFLITTDANAHNSMWGSARDDSRGKLIESIIEENGLNLLNSGSYTHYSLANNSYSTIDLTFGSPCLSRHFSWSVHTDLCSSDHFPILISPLIRKLDLSRRPRWITSAADWEKFQSCISSNASFVETDDVESKVQSFSQLILHAARESIPKTSPKIKQFKPPWWNNEISKAIRVRKKALRKYNHFMTTDNEIAYKTAKAHARRLIRVAQRTSWQEYVSNISSNTSSKEVWSKIQKISGKFSPQFITSLKIGDELINDTQRITDELAKSISFTSSSQNYTNEFLEFKNVAEKETYITTEISGNSDLNIQFSINELHQALKQCNGSSPGPDDIQYDMIKHLPIDTKYHLLAIYNELWAENKFPAKWQESLTIPIKKSNKNPLIPTNYRPISLTSCLCKVMKRMMTKRLIWFLES